jgi:hypothetical protein
LPRQNTGAVILNLNHSRCCVVSKARDFDRPMRWCELETVAKDIIQGPAQEVGMPFDIKLLRTAGESGKGRYGRSVGGAATPPPPA